MAAILEAVGGGVITPGEGQVLTGMIEAFRKNLETQEMEKRIARLEANHGKSR